MTTKETEQQTKMNPVLNNALDFNMQVINPNWKEASPTFLKNKEGLRYVEIEGQTYINVNDLVTNLDFFTRDIRLSNYNQDDIDIARWYIKFGGACASYKYFNAFNFCLLQVANISETSQGRGGFLRKILNTLTSENIQKILEPPKKSWITGKTKGEN